MQNTPPRVTKDARVARVQVDRIRAHGTNVRKDLGDLRDLQESVERFGIMHPVVVDRRPDHWLLRDGHRRVAVATMLGIDRIPAIVHNEWLEDDEWLTQAVHANQHRRQLDKDDRAHAVTRMRNAGMTWDGIAREFAVSTRTVQQWVKPETRPWRHPRGRKTIAVDTLSRWATAWRDALNHHEASPDEVLAALEQVAATGRISGHLPPARQQEAS